MRGKQICLFSAAYTPAWVPTSILCSGSRGFYPCAAVSSLSRPDFASQPSYLSYIDQCAP